MEEGKGDWRRFRLEIEASGEGDEVLVNYIQPYMRITYEPRTWRRTLFIGGGFGIVDRSPIRFSPASTYHVYYFVPQEFGDSARARKLYEQDSDDDDEDGELEPNPKLEAGEMVQSANGETDRDT